MASKEGDSEHRESKTWVLKVSIHCEGCKKKVRKILQRINGVDTIEINSQKNQAIVTGNVEAETLIRKLLKSGKHSELWPTEKKPENPKPKNNTNNEKIVKEKNEAKEVASTSSEPAKLLEAKPDTSKTELKSETDTKPEVETKPETSKPNKQTAEMKQPEEKPVENDEKKAETGKEGDEKKAENDSKPNGKEKKKKKEKKVVETEDRSLDVTPPMHQHPIYHQPMYVSSYNMVQPTQSYAHVVPMPQNHAASMNPPQVNPNFAYPNYPNYPNYSSYESLNHPPQEQYPNYNPGYQPNYPSYPMNYPSYSNENFHGSMGYEASSSSSQQQGSYDYFNDENPNSCSVM